MKVGRWQQCALGQHPGLHEAGEGCDPSLLHWTDPSGSLGPLDFPVETWKYWNKSSEGPLRCLRDWSIFYKRGLRELGQDFPDPSLPGEEKDQRSLTSVYKYLMGRSKADKARLPSVVTSDWTGATEHRLKYGRFQLNIKKTFFLLWG